MLKLPMPKRYVEIKHMKVKNALLKPNKKISKKVSKAIKKTILKEEEMKNWIQTIILIAAFISTGAGIIFTSGGEYQKINNGIETNTKQLSELIEINKNSVKRVTVLERSVDKIEIYTNLNTERIKDLRK